jgi:hypothetical protein
MLDSAISQLNSNAMSQLLNMTNNPTLQQQIVSILRQQQQQNQQSQLQSQQQQIPASMTNLNSQMQHQLLINNAIQQQQKAERERLEQQQAQQRFQQQQRAQAIPTTQVGRPAAQPTTDRNPAYAERRVRNYVRFILKQMFRCTLGFNEQRVMITFE